VLLLNQLVAWEWHSVSAVGGCLFVSAGLHLHPLALLHVCPAKKMLRAGSHVEENNRRRLRSSSAT
jgi:hypothetical protein